MSFDIEIKRKKKPITLEELEYAFKLISQSGDFLSFEKTKSRGDCYECKFWGYCKCSLSFDYDIKKGVIITSPSNFGSYVVFVAKLIAFQLQGKAFCPIDGSYLELKHFDEDLKYLKNRHLEALKGKE